MGRINGNLQQILDLTEIYRDKFIAHLDNRVVMNIPTLDGALKLACHLYSDIYSQLDDSLRRDMPVDLQDWYDNSRKHACKFYPKA